MPSNDDFKTKFFPVIFTVVIVILAATFIPNNVILHSDYTPVANATLEKHLELQVEDGVPLNKSSIELTEASVTPLLDGKSLLERHCVQCHSVQWLQQIKRPRSEWEPTIIQMQRFGVFLSHSERDILIEYLDTDAEPWNSRICLIQE